MDIKRYLEIQRSEIERHKWIESEKAGRDLGSDAAIDWIMRFAADFSAQFHESNGKGARAAMETCRRDSETRLEKQSA